MAAAAAAAAGGGAVWGVGAGVGTEMQMQPQFTGCSDCGKSCLYTDQIVKMKIIRKAAAQHRPTSHFRRVKVSGLQTHSALAFQRRRKDNSSREMN